MDILLGILFSAALQTALPSADATSELTAFRGATAQLQQPCRAEKKGIGRCAVQSRSLAVPDSIGNREHLLFYLSAHAQTVGDLSEGLWMPWLELRTLANQGQDIASEMGRKADLRVGHANDTCGLNFPVRDARGQWLSPLNVRCVMRLRQAGQLVDIN